MKKIIKAHKGFAHVPESSGQQTPSKAKGTAGTTPRPKRMIGLPQRFRGNRRNPFGNNPKIISGTMKKVRDSRPTAAAPQAPPTVRPTRAMPEPAVIQQPKPVVRPPKIMDGDGGRGGRPVFELPNKGRGKNIRRPKPQIRRAQAPRTPMVGKPIPRIMNQGGYISRAKYGQVDNLKKGK
tara:strand:- start:97 stop:636 length:540 start_codon:yes stop_codon:yes gene_type:complete